MSFAVLALKERHMSSEDTPSKVVVPPSPCRKAPQHIMNLRKEWDTAADSPGFHHPSDYEGRRRSSTMSSSSVPSPGVSPYIDPNVTNRIMLRAEWIMNEYPRITYADYKRILVKEFGMGNFSRLRTKLRMRHANAAVSYLGDVGAGGAVDRSKSRLQSIDSTKNLLQRPRSRPMSTDSIDFHEGNSLVTFHFFLKSRKSLFTWKKIWFPYRFEVGNGVLYCYEESVSTEFVDKQFSSRKSTNRPDPTIVAYLRNGIVGEIYRTKRSKLPFFAFIVRKTMVRERGNFGLRQMSLKLGAPVLSELVRFKEALSLASVTQALIPRSHLTIIEKIGEGADGTVFKGTFCGCVVAVKHLSCFRGEGIRVSGRRFRRSIRPILNELRILERARHRNVVALFGVCVENGNSFGSSYSIELPPREDVLAPTVSSQRRKAAHNSSTSKKKKTKFGFTKSFSSTLKRFSGKTTKKSRTTSVHFVSKTIRSLRDNDVKSRRSSSSSSSGASKTALFINALKAPASSTSPATAVAAAEDKDATFKSGNGDQLPCGVSIVMELCKYSLSTFLHGSKLEHMWSCSVFENIVEGIVSGMRFLHNQNIEQGDLKPQNILLTDRMVVKIADFGISRQCSEKDSSLSLPSPHRGGEHVDTTPGGTPEYMAPELIDQYMHRALKGRSPKSKISHNHYEADVFAFAIVLWEIWTRQYPYADKNHMARFTLMRRVRDGFRLRIDPKYFPRALGRLVEACWCHDKKCRPTFAEILHTIRTTAFLREIRESQSVWFSRPDTDGPLWIALPPPISPKSKTCSAQFEDKKEGDEEIDEAFFVPMQEDPLISPWTKSPAIPTPTIIPSKPDTQRVRARYESTLSDDDMPTDEEEEREMEDLLCKDFGGLYDPTDVLLASNEPVSSTKPPPHPHPSPRAPLTRDPPPDRPFLKVKQDLMSRRSSLVQRHRLDRFRHYKSDDDGRSTTQTTTYCNPLGQVKDTTSPDRGSSSYSHRRRHYKRHSSGKAVFTKAYMQTF